MLDLHCHILPAVDDGPPTLDEALALARFCAQDGITHVVATPHCHRHTRLLRADVLPHVARFNAELAAAGLPLTVLPGSEVQVTDADEYRREYDRPEATFAVAATEPTQQGELALLDPVAELREQRG